MEQYVTMTERLRRMEHALGQQCNMLGVRFAMDRPAVVHAFPSDWVAQLLEGLSLYALSTLEGAGELLITTVPTQHGLEIEVAVSPARDANLDATSPGLSGGSRNELERCRQLALALGGELVVQDCPDGGTAYTVVLAPPMAHQRAA